MRDETSDPQSYQIIGAAMEVHRELGCGFHERVYRDPFSFELAARGVPFVPEARFQVVYKGHTMPLSYHVDFVCYGEVLVELKALSALTTLELSQVINYLRVSNLRRGLLINFGARSLQFKRVAWGPIAPNVR
ncbi:MAG: GxxExxY protein [Acidobacteriota bacterium]